MTCGIPAIMAAAAIMPDRLTTRSRRPTGALSISASAIR